MLRPEDVAQRFQTRIPWVYGPFADVQGENALISISDAIAGAAMNTPKRLVTVEELADYLQVPSTWVYDRTAESAQDKIPHFKIGKYLRFDLESEEFMAWMIQKFRQT